MVPQGRARRGGSEAADASASESQALAAAFEVSRHLDLVDQVREVADRVAAWTGAGGTLALALDEEGRSLVRVAGSLADDDPRSRALHRIPVDRVAAWWERGAREFSGLGPLDPGESARDGPPAGRVFALPLRGAGAPVALVLAFEPREVPAERIARFEELARSAIGNALRVQAIRELVIKDDTADCFNRRYFDNFLAEELARARRFRAALSLVFFDMDNLKEVNSRYGHAMGSRALLEVSHRVRTKIRKFDKLFRFGGDEFCIVLPETDWHGALEVAERVREAIASRPLLSGSGAVPEGVSMTASFGIASFPLHASSKEGLVQQADRAMQRIKNGAKNSIGVAEVPRGEHAG